MDSHELTATAFITTRLTALALFVAGVFYVLQPDWLGWSWISARLGGETRLVSIGVGFVFLMLAGQALENSRLRLKIAEMLESFRQLLYGKNYRAEREMIVVMIEALASDDAQRRKTAHEHLKRLTGNSFASDPAVWRSWWKANERYFELNDRPPKKPMRVDPAGDELSPADLKPDSDSEDAPESDTPAAPTQEPPRP